MSGGSGGCGWTRTTRESTSLVHGQRAHFSMQRGLVGHPRTESRHRPQSQSREQQSESERAPSALVVRSVPCCLQFLHRTRPKSETGEYSLFKISKSRATLAAPSACGEFKEEPKIQNPKSKTSAVVGRPALSVLVAGRARGTSDVSPDSGPGTSMLPPLRRTDANRPPRAVGRAARVQTTDVSEQA